MRRMIVLAVASALGRPPLPHVADIAYMGGLQITHPRKQQAQWKSEQGPQRRGKRGRR